MADQTETLADYIRAENAKEREAAGLDGDGPDLPVAETITAAESARPSDDGGSVEPEPAPEPVETAAAERNTDGTFKGKRDKVQERINQAIKAQREAERRADAAEARARELDAQRAAPPPAAEPPPAATSVTAPTDAPSIDQFLDQPDPYAAHAVAAARWAATQALAERDAAVAQATERQQATAFLAQSDAQGRDQFPDWDDVINSDFATTFPVPVHLLAAIRESEQSAALRYYLASHPDDARDLASASPVSALVKLGQLAARLSPATDGSGPQTIARSQAKPLTKPLRGSSSSAPSASPPDPATTKLSDWIRINNAADRRRERDARGA